MDKKMISPHIEWCVKQFPGLRTIFYHTNYKQTSTWYLKFMFYRAVFKIFLDTSDVSNCYAQTVLCVL